MFLTFTVVFQVFIVFYHMPSQEPNFQQWAGNEPKDKLIRRHELPRDQPVDVRTYQTVRKKRAKAASARSSLRQNAPEAYGPLTLNAELLASIPRGWTTGNPPKVGENCIYLPHNKSGRGAWHRGKVIAISAKNSNCKYGCKEVDVRRSGYEMRNNKKLRQWVIKVPFDHAFACPPNFVARMPRQ